MGSRKYSQCLFNKPNSEIQPLHCSPKRTIEIMMRQVKRLILRQGLTEFYDLCSWRVYRMSKRTSIRTTEQVHLEKKGKNGPFFYILHLFQTNKLELLGKTEIMINGSRCRVENLLVQLTASNICRSIPQKMTGHPIFFVIHSQQYA